MTTRPIPKAAMPVAEIIRRDVPRPDELPIPLEGRFLRWRTWVCPMGLHSASFDASPSDKEDFAAGICTQNEVKAFAQYWDKLTDPQAAVDAVWGE